jgi:hypothetical protein
MLIFLQLTIVYGAYVKGTYFADCPAGCVTDCRASVLLQNHVEAWPNGPGHLRTGEDNWEELEGGLGRFEEE